MTSLRRVLAALAMLASASAGHAVQPDELLADPALEARARTLSAELRCLVCQNQSIDDSDAQLARDLRLLVRDRLTAGDSDPAVLDFVVRRYGEFVLLKPVIAPHTLLLWGGPLLVVIAGIAGLLAARRRHVERATAPLTDAEAEGIARVVARAAPPDQEGSRSA